MEVHTFKMRVPKDGKVRISFAPDNLRQSSNDNSQLNENEPGINDHLTSARFNFPDETDEHHLNEQGQLEDANNHGSLPSQKNYQLQQQTGYQRKNLDLHDFSSNGKHNLNSNGNYNTQRTNQSNQTLSESNTVVKEKQPEEILANEEEEYEDDSHHPHHNFHQHTDQYGNKYQQQPHYDQLMLHRQQLQQKQKVQYPAQVSHLAVGAQQKRLVYDLQNDYEDEEEQQQHQQQLYIQNHNQSQNSVLDQEHHDLNGEDGQSVSQQNQNNRKGMIQQQQQHQQMQGSNYTSKQQQQQQNFASIKSTKLNADTNGMFAQKYGMYEQFDETPENQHQFYMQNGGQYYGGDDEEQIEYINNMDSYNPHLAQKMYLNQLQQQQQQYQNIQQLKYHQKIQQMPPQQSLMGNTIAPYQQKQHPQTALQQMKQLNQDLTTKGVQKLPQQQIQQQNGQIKNQSHKRNLSQLNYMQQQHNEQRVEQTYSDDEVLTLTHGEEDDQHLEMQQKQEQQQQGNHQQQIQRNTNQQSNLDYSNHMSYSPDYPQVNTTLQQINKQAIDEHSNNTSNNEEGIVNISSIKKTTTTIPNTPVNNEYPQPIPPSSLLRENGGYKNGINWQDASKQLQNYKTNIQQTNLIQSQNRKNNFQEDKENLLPMSSSLTKSQRDNTNNQKKGGSLPANKQQIVNTQQLLHQSVQHHRKQSTQYRDIPTAPNATSNFHQLLDISADENIQDTSYSAFLPGNQYLEEDIYSQNTSMIKHPHQQQQNGANNFSTQTNQKQNVNNSNMNKNYPQQKKQLSIIEGGQRFTEENNSDCTKLNINELTDDCYCDGDKKNTYYQEEFIKQQQNIHQIKGQNIQPSLAHSRNSSQQQHQNKSSMITTYNSNNNNTNTLQNSKQIKTQPKTSNSNTTTQSTTNTFQTQGFPRDSLGNKENLFNMCNLTNEDQTVNTLENKLKSKASKEDKSNSEEEFDQIELDQVIENQNENTKIQQKEENGEYNINKSLIDSKHNAKIKTNYSRNSSQESEHKNDLSKLDQSKQMYDNYHREYKKVYYILNYERNKNEAQEKIIQSKSQMILDFQKVYDQMREENEQLKQEKDKLDQTVLDQKKRIGELEELQKQQNHKESEINHELMQDNEKLLNDYSSLQSEYKQFLDQNRQLVHENKQLIKINKDLRENLQELSNKHSMIDESLQIQLEQQICSLQQQIEKITVVKDEEIDHLKKQLLNISTQDGSQYRKNNSFETSQSQLQNRKLEKGISFESITASQTAVDNSFTSSMQGYPPRYSHQSKQPHQGGAKLPTQNISCQNKNGHSTNSNFNTICSHTSQDETNTSSQNLQHYGKTRSSSFSGKAQEHHPLSNSMQGSSSNNSAQQQINHKYSGSFSHSNNNHLTEQMKLNQNGHSLLSQPQLNNFSSSSSNTNQQGKGQATYTVSPVQELMHILSLTSEQEMVAVVKEIVEQNQNTKKFINCIIDMVQKCAPQGYFANKEPDLKQCWRILKKIMDKYLFLKVNMIKDQVDQELVTKIQSYLQITDKEKIIDKITNLESENQKMTRIIILVKKTFNLEWAKSHCELEKAIEMESFSQGNPTSKSSNGLKIDQLPSQPSQLTFNGFGQLQSSHQLNSKISSSNYILDSSSSSQSPHLRMLQKKNAPVIQTQDYYNVQQQPQYQQQQAHYLHASGASSQRIDSANSNHIVHHNLLI